MLITHPENGQPNVVPKVALGRPAGAFKVPTYTCLAGFLEISESCEEAVVREVMEEVGLDVDIAKGFDFLGTQPWPVSRGVGCDLMIGVQVTAKSTVPNVNKSEIQDLRWFTVDEIDAMLQRPGFSRDATEEKPAVPGPSAMAHQLMKRWVQREREKAAGGGSRL